MADADLYLRKPDDPSDEVLIAGPLLGALRTVLEVERLADAVEQLPDDKPALALLDGTLAFWDLQRGNYPRYVAKHLVGQRFQTALARLRAAFIDRRPVAVAAYTSRPRTSEVAGAVRLMLCEQADADCNRLCTARHSDLTSCDGAAGFDDREFFELLLEPGRRSPLYRSSHLAARFALGLATGQEWSHFYYLNGGAEIARVEAPDWLADDPEPLALSHAMLVKQCQLGLGLSRGRLRGPRAGHHHRPRPCRVPPPDPHAPGTARPAHSRVRQGHIQTPALGPNTSSRQAGHPRGGQVSAPAVSRTGGRHAEGSCPRMPGRSPIKRAKRRWRVGAWLMLDINSAIPWRETRMPVGSPVGNSACSQGGSDCGKRIRPRQRRPPGRPCNPAIYDSA